MRTLSHSNQEQLRSVAAQKRGLLEPVIGLGQSLNLPILAEGVETEAQHAYLVQEGCDEVQGYLMGRPLPIADYAKLIGHQAIIKQNYETVG